MPKTEGFFGDILRAKLAPKKSPAPRRTSAPGSPPPRPTRSAAGPVNPCAGCPAEHQPKVPPTIPPDAAAVVVTSCPTEWEEASGFLRQVTAKELGGLKLGRASVTRCRQVGPEKETREMQRRCLKYLALDLPPVVPVVAVGDEPMFAMMRSRDETARYHRGLWVRSAPEWGRRVYCLEEGGGPRFGTDLQRLARALRGEGRPELRELRIVADPREEPELMAWLAAHPGPWAFDIESFDGAEFPSRPGVAVDPCHPDFRLRGVAIAWSEDEGAWLELAPLGQAVWRPWLDPVFGSPAPKAASNGHFDEEAVVYPGWAAEVVNRCEDALLGPIAVSDGRHSSLRLERLVVDMLGQDPYWDGFDKSTIRDAPLELVARAAVFDAGMALWVVTHVADMMARGEYWTG